MRIFYPLVASPIVAIAAPAANVLSAQSLVSQVNGLGDVALGLLSSIGQLILGYNSHEKEVEREKNVVENAHIIYEYVSLASLEDHSLRFKSPEICDPGVKQYSGYLDVTDGKHLFFWFFEARHDPLNTPLMLWLNGGPGCSSSTGLLFELGPCSIRQNSTTRAPYTIYNPHSWTEHANIIFLDQPTNVGFSYSSDSSSVSTSPVAALDVWAFLQLFLNRFPEYEKLPFHIAAESYGGTYAPNIGNVVHEKNKELLLFNTMRNRDFKTIQLKSIILANGLTEPYTQYASIPEYLCDGPFPILDSSGSQCTSLRSKVPTCQRLIQGCYNSGSRFSCVPAGLYCNSQLMAPIQTLGLNPYDVRKKCSKEEDGDLCYRQMGWIDDYLNLPDVKKELGADPEKEFHSCNMQVNQAFFFQGDGMHNSAALLPALLEDGIRLLVYAGNADGMCNFIGNFDWMLHLDNPYSAQFQNATTKEWHLSSKKDKHGNRRGKLAGAVRAVGGSSGRGKTGAGSYTFVSVSDAGHMVPYDQPEAASELIESWLNDRPLSG